MSVVIVGAGSVGLLIASFLVETGVDVTLLVRRDEQKRKIGQQGICRLDQEGNEHVFQIKATTDTTVLVNATCVIIAVKYSHLHTVIEELLTLKVKSPLLFLQNGIGHLELLEGYDFPQLAFATVEHGVLKRDDRTVSHNGIGTLTIGVASGDERNFDWLERVHAKRFPVARHDDVEQMMLRKVLINCMINPLTAILEVKNGELLTNDDYYPLIENLYKELIRAFPKMETILSFDQVKMVCQQTANNHSSMLVDRIARRPMEIETIVTAVIRKANDSNHQVPLLSTFEKMLYAIEKR